MDGARYVNVFDQRYAAKIKCYLLYATLRPCQSYPQASHSSARDVDSMRTPTKLKYANKQDVRRKMLKSKQL